MAKAAKAAPETQEKRPRGRPTDYRPEYCDQIVEFFAKKRDADGFPMFSAFAVEIGVVHDTLIEWRGVHPAFSEAYKTCKAIQEDALVQGALSGKFQPAFSIFTAKNVIGWRDKTETELTGKDGGAVKVESATVDASALTAEERAALRQVMLMAKGKAK